MRSRLSFAAVSPAGVSIGVYAGAALVAFLSVTGCHLEAQDSSAEKSTVVRLPRELAFRLAYWVNPGPLDPDAELAPGALAPQRLFALRNQPEALHAYCQERLADLEQYGALSQERWTAMRQELSWFKDEYALRQAEFERQAASAVPGDAAPPPDAARQGEPRKLAKSGP